MHHYINRDIINEKQCSKESSNTRLGLLFIYLFYINFHSFLFIMPSIITIISLLFLLAPFSVQAISDDPHYNVMFRQQGLENSNVI
jgi:hypothetical protein